MQLNSMKKNLDNILDKENVSESSREYVKSMMLSNSFVDAYKLYEDMPGLIFTSLVKNQYIESFGPKNSFMLHVIK